MVVVVGESVTGLPVATNVPPQLAVYQRKTPPVPSVAPLAVSCVLCPLHIVDAVTLTEPGGVEAVLTVTVCETQAVVLHVPCART